MIKQQYNNDCVIDKICFYVKNPNDAKYHYLIKKHENSSLENLKYRKTLIEYLVNKQDVLKKYWKVQPKHKM